MKILILHPSFYVDGGAEKVIIRLANWLESHSHHTTILTTTMIDEVRSQLDNTRLLLCKDYGEMKSVYDMIWHDFDVVHAHNSPAEHFATRGGPPFVWSCNEPPQHILEGLQPSEDDLRPIPFINEVVVADLFNKDRFKKVYDKDSIIVPYGIDSDYYSQKPLGLDDFKKKHDLSGKFVLVQAAWIHPMKNQEEAIRILFEVKKEKPEAVLVLAGYEDSSYKEYLKDVAKAANLEDSIFFLGHLNREDLRNLYHTCDVVLHPIKEQGGWLVPFEAASAGAKVVISDRATCSKIIHENGLGIAYEDLKSAVWSVLKGTVREDASVWVRENLSWDKYCESILKVYEEVAFGKGSVVGTQ